MTTYTRNAWIVQNLSKYWKYVKVKSYVFIKKKNNFIQHNNIIIFSIQQISNQSVRVTTRSASRKIKNLF